MLTVEFAGSGDAFGSGGRFQACISIRSEGMHLLLDCGATSLVALKQLGIDVASVDGVVVSHLHGDHFARIPFLILDQQFARRQRPLVLAGQAGVRDRVLAAMEVLFPGSASVERRFDVRFVELAAREPAQTDEVLITGYPVTHASGAPAYGLRLAWDGKVISYSGDTAWTESLIELADKAELFICEAYTFDRQVPYHLSYTRLAEHRNEFTASPHRVASCEPRLAPAPSQRRGGACTGWNQHRHVKPWRAHRRCYTAVATCSLGPRSATYSPGVIPAKA